MLAGNADFRLETGVILQRQRQRRHLDSLWTRPKDAERFHSHLNHTTRVLLQQKTATIRGPRAEGSHYGSIAGGKNLPPQREPNWHARLAFQATRCAP